jgi:hypothetical protein
VFLVRGYETPYALGTFGYEIAKSVIAVVNGFPALRQNLRDFGLSGILGSFKQFVRFRRFRRKTIGIPY